MLGHMSYHQSDTEAAASFAGGGIGVRALRRLSASGRDAMQASNKGMKRTGQKRHSPCKEEEQGSRRFSPAAYPRR